MACPESDMFYIGLYRENMKKSSCLKPLGLELWYLVCSITLWTSTKFGQIMPLGPKMAPPQVSPGTWSAFNKYLYVSFKQDSGERLYYSITSAFVQCSLYKAYL